MDHLQPRGGSFTAKRWIIYSQEVDHLQQRGGSFTAKRWVIYSQEVGHLQPRGGSFTSKRWVIYIQEVGHLHPRGGSFTSKRWDIKCRKCAICRLHVSHNKSYVSLTKVFCCRCFIRTMTSPVLSSWRARYLSSRCALPSRLFIQYIKLKLFARNKDHTIWHWNYVL